MISVTFSSPDASSGFRVNSDGFSFVLPRRTLNILPVFYDLRGRRDFRAALSQHEPASGRVSIGDAGKHVSLLVFAFELNVGVVGDSRYRTKRQPARSA